MNDIIKTVEDFFKALSSLSPELFSAIGVLAVIYLVKIVPFIPSKTIPMICIISGPVIYIGLINGGQIQTAMGSPAAIDSNISQPWVKQAIYGLVIGVMTWVFYDKFLGRVESVAAKKWPWLGQFLDSPGPKEPPVPTVREEKKIEEETKKDKP